MGIVSDDSCKISVNNLLTKNAVSAASVKANVSAARVDLTTLLTLLELQDMGQELLYLSARKTMKAP